MKLLVSSVHYKQENNENTEVGSSKFVLRILIEKLAV